MTTSTDKAPRGVRGEQRDKYLSLTTEQRETYRYHFDVCGRLAEHCYRIAAGLMPDPSIRAAAALMPPNLDEVFKPHWHDGPCGHKI